jgi:hypothetical protein
MQFGILHKNMLPTVCTRIYDGKKYAMKGNELHA